MGARRSVSGWLTVMMVVGPLAILEVKQLREQGNGFVRGHEFFGYAPNLLAAMTLSCFFLAPPLKRRAADEPYRWPWLWPDAAPILEALLLTIGGLLAWEFVQVYRPNRTFDWQDVWATLAGGLGFLLVVVGARRATARAFASCPAGIAASPPGDHISQDEIP